MCVEMHVLLCLFSCLPGMSCTISRNAMLTDCLRNTGGAPINNKYSATDTDVDNLGDFRQFVFKLYDK